MRHIMHTLWVTTMAISIGCHFGESDIDKLIEASKAKRPGGDSVLMKNPFNANDIPQVQSYIKMNPNHSSYHLLLALKKHHPEEFKKIPTVAKAQVLCSTLEKTEWLNDWSVLDPSDSVDFESANALLEIGKESIQYLVPLLSDTNGAPLEGSEDAAISSRYKYRRKDFAYRYIMLIREEQPAFHADPKERDKNIEALKAKLKKDAK
jgi:hypothetical protein